MGNPVYLGLQGLALVLIFAPEPFTTVPGIWLLAYARSKASGNKEVKPLKRENTFAHLYDHSLQLVGDSVITYEMHKKRSGQLPHTWPVTTKVYQIAQSRKDYKNVGNQHPARPQLLNGVPLPAKKLQSPSDSKLPNKLRSPSSIKPASINAPPSKLHKRQTLQRPEQVRDTKSSSLLEREHIAKMLESMRYTQSFATANARRTSP